MATYPLVVGEELMSEKAHGSCEKPVQDNLVRARPRCRHLHAYLLFFAPLPRCMAVILRQRIVSAAITGMPPSIGAIL